MTSEILTFKKMDEVGDDRLEEARETLQSQQETLRAFFRGPGWAAARERLQRRQEEIQAAVIRDFRLSPESLRTAQLTHELLDQILIDPVKFLMRKGL